MGTYAGKKMDIAIIGGGGRFICRRFFPGRRAGSAKRSGWGFGRKRRARGKKLLATGNGTCNPHQQRGGLPAIIKQGPTQRGRAVLAQVLKAFPAAEARKFFSSIGVESVEKDRGRVYPLSLQAGGGAGLPAADLWQHRERRSSAAGR